MLNKENIKLFPIPVEWQIGRYNISISYENDILTLFTVANFLGGIERNIKINILPIVTFKVNNFNFAENNYRVYLTEFYLS